MRNREESGISAISKLKDRSLGNHFCQWSVRALKTPSFVYASFYFFLPGSTWGFFEFQRRSPVKCRPIVSPRRRAHYVYLADGNRLCWSLSLKGLIKIGRAHV